MRLRILHIVNSLQVGGLENGVVNLVSRLDARNFENCICCINASGPMEKRITGQVEIHSLGKGTGRDYLLPLKIARVVKRVRPDIVHTRNWAAIDGVVAARLGGVRRIIHGEHGREASDPQGSNLLRQKARKVLNPFISKFITVSADLRRWLIEVVGVQADKVTQIINGVDIERFRHAGDTVSKKMKMGLDPDSFVIGTVGRIDPVKDIKTLIKAFSHFSVNADNKRKLKLLIIGSGSEEAKLKAFAAEKKMTGSINFLGERSDIAELMQAMDVFVLSSIAEGISNTILEAMASGLPVVATKAGGNEELVDDGKTGLVVPISDDRALAGALLQYLIHPEKGREHGENGRAKAVERFSLTSMVESYEKVYLSVGGIL